MDEELVIIGFCKVYRSSLIRIGDIEEGFGTGGFEQLGKHIDWRYSKGSTNYEKQIHSQLNLLQYSVELLRETLTEENDSGLNRCLTTFTSHNVTIFDGLLELIEVGIGSA